VHVVLWLNCGTKQPRDTSVLEIEGRLECGCVDVVRVHALEVGRRLPLKVRSRGEGVW
jgi:hypothetical protein